MTPQMRVDVFSPGAVPLTDALCGAQFHLASHQTPGKGENPTQFDVLAVETRGAAPKTFHAQAPCAIEVDAAGAHARARGRARPKRTSGDRGRPSAAFIAGFRRAPCRHLKAMNADLPDAEPDPSGLRYIWSFGFHVETLAYQASMLRFRESAAGGPSASADW